MGLEIFRVGLARSRATSLSSTWLAPTYATTSRDLSISCSRKTILLFSSGSSDLNFPGRPRSESRNQLVLNLARADVRDYVEGSLDKLLTENDIAFLKWDYNRNWSEPGWDQVPVDEQRRVYVEFIRNLYSILADLRRKHPKVEIESCSGGGGRVDLGILHYADEVWPSDNTDPFDRLSMQDGFSYASTP